MFYILFVYLTVISSSNVHASNDRLMEEAKEKAVKMFFDGELDEKSPQGQPTDDESDDTQRKAEAAEMGTSDEEMDQEDEPDPFLDQ